MAQNYSYLSEEELKEKILMIADYIIDNKASLRAAAKYASDNGFKISHVSVHYLLQNKLMELDKNRYEKVMAIINEHLPKSIEDDEVKSRVNAATSLLLQDFTIEEIAERLNSTFDIIYDDLTNRLPKLDSKKADLVKSRLEKHRLKNLERAKNKANDANKPTLDLNKLNRNVLKEIILMALTYRVSFKNLSKLLNASIEDIKASLSSLEEFNEPLYYLDIETINEDEINERVAYVNGYNYLKTRKKLLSQLSKAKKLNNKTEIDKIQNLIAEHHHLVDDSVAYGTVGKNLNILTEEEKEAIARYRLKYALSKRKVSTIFQRKRENSIDLIEEELAAKNPIYKEKIERLNDYMNMRKNGYIHEAANNKKR